MSSIIENVALSAAITAGAVMNPGISEEIGVPAFTFEVVCFGPDDARRDEYLDLLGKAWLANEQGQFERAQELRQQADALVKLQWREAMHNLVTTVGKTDIVDKYFNGSAYTAAWYLGLKGTGSAAVGDTLASHAGWSEVTPYSGNRPAITFGTTSSGSNTASAVSYSINATATVAGAFIASVNTGTAGTLYSAGDFAASRSVASGDTLNVTPTVSVS